MDQEKVLHQLTNVGKFTGELLLKWLSYMMAERGTSTSSLVNKIPGLGPSKEETFMAKDTKKLVETFKATELNLNSLKSYLDKFGVEFIVTDHADGLKSLTFEANNKALVEEAFTHTLKQLTEVDKAESLIADLEETPEKMSVEDKLIYYEGEMEGEIAAVEVPQAALDPELLSLIEEERGL